MDTLAVILGMAIATYATRAPALLLLSRRLPPGIERFLSHIPAAIAAWWTRRVLPTILAGLLACWLIRWLG